MGTFEKHCQESAALFGSEAEAVARRHIMTDLGEEGWTEQDPFPKDEA